MGLPIAAPNTGNGTDMPLLQLKVTPSNIVLYQDCPRAYKYKVVDRLKPKKQSVNLSFGTALHEAFERSIACHHRKISLDATAIFKATFDSEIAGKVVSYPNKFDYQSMLDMGMKLAERFHDLWPSFGLTPLEDDKGELLMEKRMELMLPDNILLVGKMDLPVLDQTGRLGILDLKTARSEVDQGFLLLSDQLTSYQVLVDGNADVLGTPGEVSQLGFLEAIKRKVSDKGQGPTIETPKFTKRRSDKEIAEWIEKIRWMAAQIRAEAFHKTPRMAYNSPCDMCDFSLYCQTGSKAELQEKEVFGFAPANTLPSQVQIQVPQGASRRRELATAFFGF